MIAHVWPNLRKPPDIAIGAARHSPPIEGHDLLANQREQIALDVQVSCVGIVHQQRLRLGKRRTEHGYATQQEQPADVAGCLAPIAIRAGRWRRLRPDLLIVANSVRVDTR
jgi:hypothetical protein